MRKPPVTKAVKPSVTLEIEGEAYRLVFDYNAIADAETLAGCNLLHGISASMFGTLSAAQLRGLLYAALKPEQPAITLKEAGDLIRIDRLPDIYRAISEAWAVSLPANPSEAGATAPPAEN